MSRVKLVLATLKVFPNLRVSRQLTCESEGPCAGERDEDGEEGGEQVVVGPCHPAYRARAAHEGHRVLVGHHRVQGHQGDPRHWMS